MSIDTIKGIRKGAHFLAKLRKCPVEALDGMRLVYEDETHRASDPGTSVILFDVESGAGLTTYTSGSGHAGHEDMYGRLIRVARVVIVSDVGFIRSLDPVTCSPRFRHGATRDLIYPIFEWSKIAKPQGCLDRLFSRHRWGRSCYSMVEALGDRQRLREMTREECLSRMADSEVGNICNRIARTVALLHDRIA